MTASPSSPQHRPHQPESGPQDPGSGHSQGRPQDRTRLRRIALPDLSSRPLRLDVERTVRAAPAVVYRAWTVEFDAWFAAPGTLLVRAREDEPFFFEVVHEGTRAPHYGRFLTLDPDRLVELTWVTGESGTEGAETVVRVHLTPTESGTLLQLTHSGFATQAALARHEQAWPSVLARLDEQLALRA